MPDLFKAVNSIGIFSSYDFYECPDGVYLLDTHLRLSSLIPSLSIGINVSLSKGNEPQTTQLGGADLATPPHTPEEQTFPPTSLSGQSHVMGCGAE